LRIIGVIDLKGGLAVHARGGRRATYAPIGRSAGRAIDGHPFELARLYVETFGLAEIYVADLDALASGPPQDRTIRGISALGVSLLVDAGIADTETARRVTEAGAATLVVGLETLPSFDALTGICAQSGRPVAFSLDLRDGVPFSGGASSAQTPQEIAQRAIGAGVQSIIVLDVARVGAGAGPDLEMFRRIRTVAGDVPVLAGGGVRGVEDLRTLAQAGCSGALIATALHEGRLTRANVATVRSWHP
jgi:phosphoribosylformimino-5-aminoimidazole carboxamide ribotide isomerase